METPSVHIIYTGGTIGMLRKEVDGPLQPGSPEALLEAVQELETPDITLTVESLEPPLDSSDITPRHWVEIAKRIEKVYTEVDGFVILHGTDTMAYTASGLSFILENLAKPVVITGSQLPISDPRSDARGNLVSSIMLAGHKATNLPCIPEVILVFASRILRGCRATKVSSRKWEGFDSPNCPHIGEIGEHIHIYRNRIRTRPEGESEPPLIVHRDICREVEVQRVYPGLTPERLKNIYADSSTKGVVLETFGAGNVPSDDLFVDAVTELHDSGKGITFVNVTQCLHGRVEMGLYKTSEGLLDTMASGLDMTTEAAYAKLMFTLRHVSVDARRNELQRSLRGEQSRSISELRFEGIQSNAAAREYTSSLPTPDGYVRSRLDHASIRLRGLSVSDVKAGEEVDIRIFVNQTTATVRTSKDDTHPAASFKFMPENTDPLIKDVTSTVLKVVQPDDTVTIKIIASEGKVSFDECILSIFQREPV